LPSEEMILRSPLESPCTPMPQNILPTIKTLIQKHLFGVKA
jgi:hypothetical protein